MAFDYKKAYKEFYLPSGQPELVTVPEMTFLAVRGMGDPNLPDGQYKQAIGAVRRRLYNQNEQNGKA